MDNLPNEIFQTIISKLARDDICRMASCYKKCFQIISDEQTWRRLLNCHFHAQPLPELTARQSYHFYHFWPRYAVLIYNKCKKEPDFRTVFSGDEKYFHRSIEIVGPANYNNIEIIWPEIWRFCDVRSDQKS